MKIYLGGAMFTLSDVNFNLNLANQLRQQNFEVYCPNENAEINDKTRTDITGEKIYAHDTEELEGSNIFLCQFTEDSGTMWGRATWIVCLNMLTRIPILALSVSPLTYGLRLRQIRCNRA